MLLSLFGTRVGGGSLGDHGVGGASKRGVQRQPRSILKHAHRRPGGTVLARRPRHKRH